ncbi:putative mitochondrial protein, partial [Mucuna pruriens]
MTSIGNEQSEGEHTLFIKHSTSRGVTILLVYMWMILLLLEMIGGNNNSWVNIFAYGDITPMDSKLKLGNADDSVTVDKEMYQCLVGKLIYLSHTRPNIAFSISLINQFMHCPREVHLQATYKILQYLKGTLGRGILYKRNGNTILEAYTDADYVRSLVDRRSTPGYYNFLEET